MLVSGSARAQTTRGARRGVTAPRRCSAIDSHSARTDVANGTLAAQKQAKGGAGREGRYRTYGERHGADRDEPG